MFRKIRWLALSILVLPSLAAAQVTLDDIRNMPVNSWLQVPGTNLSAVDPCPTHDCAWTGVEGITGIHSYSGAVLDTKRNRYVCFGGGHDAYYGNEVYAFAIDELKWYRLTDPSDPIVKFTEKYADGNPTSRHTYNGLAYITHADRMMALGGSGAGGGCGCALTWTFDFGRNQWFDMQPAGPLPAPECDDLMAYDPVGKKIWWAEGHISGGTERWGLYSYDFDRNAWTHVDPDNGYTRQIAVVDPKRRLLVIVGGDGYGGQYWVIAYDLASADVKASRQVWTTTGATGLISDYYKGLEYDPVADKYVGIGGNGTVYALDPDTKVWTSCTPAGTKPDMSWLAGIYGLWRYVPSVNAYIFETHAKRDVSFYKFTAGGGTALEQSSMQAPAQRIIAQPNPFRTSITLRTQGSGPASVYDLKGRLVARLNPDKGAYQWRPSGMTPGIYVVKIRFNGTILSEKILLAR